MYYEFIDSPIPKVGEYSVIMGKILEKGSIVPSLIEHVMEDINLYSIDRLDNHVEFLDLLDSYCVGTYGTDLGWSGFLIPREAEGISALISGEPIPEEEFGESTYCHMDTIRAKNKFRRIFTNNYNYFRRHNVFTEDFNLAGLQYDFTNPSEEMPGEFFIEITERDASQGLKIPITKEGGGTLGNYRIRPNFKLPVDYEFNNFDDTSTLPNEMCLFVAGCADFDDVVERYNLDPNSIKEEPCDYYDRCDAAKEAKDIFEIPYEIIRFLCSGDCEQPACDSDDHTLTQSKLPTNCRTDCNRFFGCNAPESALDCFCTPPTEQCSGSCVPYCSSDDKADTKCMDNPCNSYVPGTCDSTSDCGCSNGYSCSGDCVD